MVSLVVEISGDQRYGSEVNFDGRASDLYGCDIGVRSTEASENPRYSMELKGPFSSPAGNLTFSITLPLVLQNLEVSKRTCLIMMLD